MKWFMNPDNNPTILVIALVIAALCVFASFGAANG
ncbi:hypothetical protein DyAD56_16105 [Dyella sp. AD56]|nr:hypothetical protein DyAD56_16105 [Dyella sp. AD56]